MSPWFGPFIAFCSSLTWAVGSTQYAKISVRHSAYALNFSRALVAFPLFLIALLYVSGSPVAAFHEVNAVNARQMGYLVLSIFSSYVVGDVLFFYGTRYLGIPGTLAIASAYPLWNALVAVVFEGEKLQLLQILGLLITIFGIIVVILNGPSRGQLSVPAKSKSGVGVGVLLAFGTSVFWAINSYALAHVGREISATVGNLIRMGIAIGFTFVMGRIFTPKSTIGLPLKDLKSTSWVFFVEAFGGSFFFLYGLAHSSLSFGAVLTSLAPVISVPIAWVLRLEKFSFFRTLGVILCVLGLCLLVGA